ncbi:hypothetical protein LCM00_17110 [Bacillus infantis]|uniref:hypothetical protein n=1 Tax=Bacillus infantis TaxID=324767 RepID=UPI001CD54938|nr:hypothetical protein [Bacillus infantis]MCA1041237.1 hypothetical protein [Bacillus infantis]
MDIAFMVAIAALFFYQIFIKADKDEWSGYHPDSFSILARYLYFGTMTSIYAYFAFRITWLPWIALYSLLGVIISFKPKDAEAKNRKRTFVLIALLLLIINMIRIPNNPDSFQDYISSKETYQCIHSFECVKMASVINSDDSLETKVEVLPVEGYTYHSYFLFAKASMTLEGEEERKGINIAGFWIEY